MCDPISIAGAALSGAGMAANSIAANQVSSATNAATQQTEYLNQIQQSRAFNANNRAADTYKGFAAGQGAMGQQLGDFLAKNSVGREPPPSAMAPVGASTSAAIAAGAPAVAAFGDQQAHALGNLNSFGDYLAQTNRGAGRHLETARQADDFMRGNSSVLGLELNDASHAGDTASLIGQGLTGAGGLGIKAGLSSAGKAWDPKLTSFGGLFAPDPTAAAPPSAIAGRSAGQAIGRSL